MGKVYLIRITVPRATATLIEKERRFSRYTQLKEGDTRDAARKAGEQIIKAAEIAAVESQFASSRTKGFGVVRFQVGATDEATATYFAIALAHIIGGYMDDLAPGADDWQREPNDDERWDIEVKEAKKRPWWKRPLVMWRVIERPKSFLDD